MTASCQTSINFYGRLGGEAPIARFVSRLYGVMAELPEARYIWNWHPQDMDGVKARVTSFLCGWLGGPSDYAERYGPPMMRRRHLPFPIGPHRQLQPAYRPSATFAPAIRQCLGYGVARAERALASDEKRVVLFADRQELDLDQVAIYAVPLPSEFRQTRGRRFIRVALAFDPPTRHTRLEYLSTRMSFHLLRGLTPDQILEHYRRRDDGTRHPEIPASAKCKMEPSPEARETSTLQCATFTQSANRDEYGDTFYVAVFAQRRWAGDDVVRQRFFLAVELTHDGCHMLHQRCTALNAELRIRHNVRA